MNFESRIINKCCLSNLCCYRKSLKRPRRMGKLAIEAPSPSHPPNCPREVRIKPPLLTFGRKSRPSSPAMQAACDLGDPIVTPFTTPKLPSKDMREREEAQVFKSIELTGVATDEVQKKPCSPTMCEGHHKNAIQLNAHRTPRVLSGTHELKTHEESEGEVKSVSQRTVVRNMASEAQSEDCKTPSYVVREESSSGVHSGGLLSNHITLSMETLRTPICSQRLLLACPSSRKLKSSIPHQVRKPGHGTASLDKTPQNPCRALSFEKAEFMERSKTPGNEQEPILLQSTLVRKAVKPKTFRKILKGSGQDDSVGREKSPATPFDIDARVVEKSSDGIRVGAADGLDDRQDTSKRRNEWTRVAKEIVMSSPYSVASRRKEIAKTGHGMSGRSLDRSKKEEENGAVCRRAEPPILARKLNDTEFSSDEILESPLCYIARAEGEEEVFIYQSQDVAKASDDTSFLESSEQHDAVCYREIVSTSLQVADGRQMASNRQHAGSPAGKDEESFASVTEPPTPDGAFKEKTDELQKSSRTTVLCRSMLVTIPAGALRSPKTPDSVSKE